MTADLTLLLPRATRWAEKLERDILATGRVLRPHEIPIAVAVAIKAPERIRIRSVKAIAPPRDSILAKAAEKAGLHWARMAGLTLGYGILIRAYSLELCAHELAHVAQYERHGSIAAFLERYLEQVLTYGYANAPLEKEAREIARGYAA